MIFDIIAGTGDTTGGIGSWTPAELFKNGEQGAWYDSSDWTLMYQDSTATQVVNALGQSVGAWFNKIAGQAAQYDIGQATGTSRPTTVSNGGKLAVRFDGSDDQVAGNLIGATYSAITMAIGQRKSVAETSVAFELSASTSTFLTNVSNRTVSAWVLNSNAVSTGLTSLSSANTIIAYGSSTVPATVRVNGTTTTGGAIGAVNAALTVKFPGEVTNDCDISQVVFINRILTAGELTLLESYIASKQ